MVEISEECNYDFPYPSAYNIQRDLMSAITKCLNSKKVGIFESPTGTGKSLSLICALLTWLKKQERAPRPKSPVDTDPLGWMKKIGEFKREAENKLVEEEKKAERKKRKSKVLEYENNNLLQYPGKRMKGMESKEDVLIDNLIMEAQFLLLDGDGGEPNAQGIGEPNPPIPKTPNTPTPQIIYCSRTHSQLSQFIGELKKSKFGAIYTKNTESPINPKESLNNNNPLYTTTVPLVSRKALCINPFVNNGQPLSRMRERCEDMRIGKLTPKCVHQGEQAILLVDRMLDYTLDIEDLCREGRNLHACPYIACRQAVLHAELTTTVYQCLLHRETRNKMGIDVTGKIIVFDEAHNVVDTICNLYTVEITHRELSKLYALFTLYHDKYLLRLSPMNLMLLEQLINVMKALLKYLKGNQGGVMDVIHLLCACGIEGIDFFRLGNFLRNSRVGEKVLGFRKYLGEKEKINNRSETYYKSSKSEEYKSERAYDQRAPEIIHLGHIHKLESLLTSFTTIATDGEYIISGGVKYFLLNPYRYFKDILESSRNIIFLGGTMHPVEELEQILPLPREQILNFRCGHIIPDTNLLSLTLGAPFTPVDKHQQVLNLDLRYHSRGKTTLLDNLGNILLTVCGTAPGGVVCFFSSYKYKHTVSNYLFHTKYTEYGEKILQHKILFEEDQDQSGDSLLSAYSKQISLSSSPGGLLLCVMGGKLSEGINFSDDLCRCILVIGMPYPNPTDPQIIHTMRYLDQVGRDKRAEGLSHTYDGQMFYENSCMKSVNQTVGRAIRHRADYAALILVDNRYATSKVKDKLSPWVAKNIFHVHQLSMLSQQLTTFFHSHGH